MRNFIEKIKLQLLVLFAIQVTWAQSIEIKPNQTYTSTKKGPNQLVINSVILDENNSNQVASGNSKIVLSGEIGATNGSYFDHGSTQSVEFNHLSTKRWILGDFFYNHSFEPLDTLNAFQIQNHSGFTYATPLNINKKDNFIGFHTSKPQAKLHLTAAISGVKPFANTSFFVENNNHNYLHLGTVNGFDNGILFSNAIHNPSFGGSIIYKADNRMLLQTDGSTRMLIGATGRVGINTTSPAARLHVFNGLSGVSGIPADEFIVENSANNYIQMMNPQANEAGLLFGLPSSLVSGGIIYNNSSSGALDFRTNNNVTQMRIDNTGKVGVGTSTPVAKLDINGTAKIGSNGSVLVEVIKETVGPFSFNLGPGAGVSFFTAITNVQPGSSIIVTTSKELPFGIVQNASCIVGGTVRVSYYNATALSQTLNDFQIYITVIR